MQGAMAMMLALAAAIVVHATAVAEVDPSSAKLLHPWEQPEARAATKKLQAKRSAATRQLMRQKMKEVPPWALKEFQKVIKKERAVKASQELAFHASEALVQNLTSAVEVTAAALKEKEKTIAEKERKLQSHKATSKQMQEMKVELEAANSRAQHMQDELDGAKAALAKQSAATKVLRDRNGGYASHVELMMSDVHATLRDERAAREAAEKKESDLALELAHTRQLEEKLSPELAKLKQVVHQEEAEKAKLTASLEHSKSKLASVSHKLEALAKTSQKTVKRLRSKLNKAKSLQSVETKTLAITKTNDGKDTKQLTKKLQQSELLRKKESDANRKAYLKLLAEKKKVDSADLKLKYSFVRQHKNMKMLKDRAMHAERMVAAEHREMMENKMEKLAFEKKMKRMTNEVLQAKRVAIHFNQKAKEAAKANAEYKLRDRAAKDTTTMNKLKAESKSLEEARQVLKETYAALRVESRDNAQAHKKVHQLIEALSKKKAQLHMRESDRADLEEKLKEADKQNRQIEQKRAQGEEQLKQLTAKLGKADVNAESQAKDYIAMSEQVAAAHRKEEKAVAELAEAKKKEQEAEKKEKEEKLALEAAQKSKEAAVLKKSEERNKELQAKLEATEKQLSAHKAHAAEHTTVDVTHLYDAAKKRLKDEEHKAALISFQNAQDESKIKKLSAALIKVSHRNSELLAELPSARHSLRGASDLVN